MRRKGVLKELRKAIAVTLVFFAIVECFLRVAYFIRNSMVTYVPLPYVIGDYYGPLPPWLGSLMILAPDEDLIWRNRPNLRRRYVDSFSPVHTDEERTLLLRRFRPALPNSLKGSPVWEISLNSEGFRDAEVPERKPASAFRILCLGDSWTFGMNVGQEQTYPQRLKALLREEFPEVDFEVFNRGVLGYSSYQGLELLRRRAIDLNPDVVVIGFAMNDAKVNGYRDKDMAAYEKNLTLRTRIGRFLEKIETYKLLEYLALVLKHKPKSIGDRLKEEADSAEGAEGEKDFEKLEPRTRVSLGDYEKNILEMIHLARSRQASVVLLYNELWKDGPYRVVLEKISRSEGVPLVDSSALIAEARRKMEEELEGELDFGLVWTGRTLANGEIEVVFRVYLGKSPVPKAMYIVGAHPKLGDLVPNKVAMYDDGTHGDQRAGDTVWTYSATFSPGTTLFYVYTNSGEERKWEGLDVPCIRDFKVEAKDNEEKIYRPIESFGRIYMQADSWHTDASGYELIAKALLEVLKQNEKLKEHVHHKG